MKLKGFKKHKKLQESQGLSQGYVKVNNCWERKISGGATFSWLESSNDSVLMGPPHGRGLSSGVTTVVTHASVSSSSLMLL